MIESRLKSNIQYWKYICTVEELRTRRTAGCPLILKGVSLGGEEGFHTSMMWQSEPTPFPRPKRREWCSFCYEGWSSPFTLPNNSWPSPFWRWRRGAQTCWAGAAGVWTAGGSGWVWRAAVACWCKPEQLCGTRCGCSSQRWRLNTPDKPQHPTVWPWQSPVMGDAQTQFAIVSQSVFLKDTVHKFKNLFMSSVVYIGS